MYAQSHRSNASMSNLSLPMDEPFTPPTHRMSMPGPGSFVESPTRQLSRPRSKSPLRNSVTFGEPSSTDGSPLPPDDDPWGQRGGPYTPSLTGSAPSVARFANNLAQRVNSLFSEPRSPSLLPTDAELEAEAAAERDRSRREAERILSREAEDRRKIEENVMNMRQNSLPPPPPSPGGQRGRSASPARKEKEGWWSAAKQKLTPTKEPLTPAQQIIQDTKAREKQHRGKSKDVSRERERTLSTPSIPPFSNAQQNASSNTLGSSPANNNPPLYVQFGADGAVDVNSTLMTIARRFEKLERWTVGHVRALEERMNDVEKWLVDKEKERDTVKAPQPDPSTMFQQATVAKDVEDMKDELSELKGRITEIGREMVTIRRDASRQQAAPSPAPAPVPAQAPPARVTSPSISPALVGSTFSSGSISSQTSRSRYPAGDYRSSSSSVMSPPTSPPARTPHALPSPSGPLLAQTLRTPSPLPPLSERAASPTAITPTTPQPSNLPAPPSQRPPSVSPPRKRYTVALGGGPISQQREKMETAYFSSASLSDEPASQGESDAQKDEEEEEEEGGAKLTRQATIGSTPIALSRLSLSPPSRPHPDPISTSPSPMGRSRPRPQSAVFGGSPSPGNSRIRAQSTYGAGSAAQSAGPHSRSKSIDRYGLGLDAPLTAGAGTGKFVDPLLQRRKEAAVVSPKPVLPQGRGKIPIGQLVAFFDGDKNTS
ncbi:hypothetical protein AURDEDRAFT_98436 [Auricularia subglabra TFB-10046 SS5]|nr:hypothetical protein AURDEDRAFT_98436 [Auricularia subglabra TFB-10046 SS5]